MINWELNCFYLKNIFTLGIWHGWCKNISENSKLISADNVHLYSSFLLYFFFTLNKSEQCYLFFFQMLDILWEVYYALSIVFCLGKRTII